MNVYDTANKLAQEIKQAQEYLEYKKIKDEINSYPELKQKIEEFTKLRYEVQLKSFGATENQEEEFKKVQEKYMELLQNEKIKMYFDLELKFSVLIADINKIIGEAIKDVMI